MQEDISDQPQEGQSLQSYAPSDDSSSNYQAKSKCCISENHSKYFPSQQKKNSSITTDREYYRDITLDQSKELFNSGNPHFNNQMKPILFTNHVLMVRYLSMNRKKFSFVAEHYFDQKLAYKSNKLYDKFRLCLEKGEANFILPKYQRSNQDFVTHILDKKGPSELLFWLECLVSGIIEMERAGIYHLDICFRNTIRIVNRDQNGKRIKHCYKIIDFDYAFKPDYSYGPKFQKCPQQIQLINNTKVIIEHWLSAPSWTDQKFVKFLFKGSNDKKKDYWIDILQAIKQSLKSTEQKCQQVMQHLSNHKSHSHLQQLWQIIDYIFRRKDVSGKLLNSMKQVLDKIDAINDQPQIKEAYFDQIRQILNRNQSEWSLFKTEVKTSKSQNVTFQEDYKKQFMRYGYGTLHSQMLRFQKHVSITELSITNTAYWFEELRYIKNIDDKYFRKYFKRMFPRLAAQLSKFINLEVLTLRSRYRLLDWAQFDPLIQALNGLPKLREIRVIMTPKSLEKFEMKDHWATKLNKQNRKVEIIYKDSEITYVYVDKDDTNFTPYRKVKEI